MNAAQEIFPYIYIYIYMLLKGVYLCEFQTRKAYVDGNYINIKNDIRKRMAIDNIVYTFGKCYKSF